MSGRRTGSAHDGRERSVSLRVASAWLGSGSTVAAVRCDPRAGAAAISRKLKQGLSFGCGLLRFRCLTSLVAPHLDLP